MSSQYLLPVHDVFQFPEQKNAFALRFCRLRKETGKDLWQKCTFVLSAIQTLDITLMHVGSWVLLQHTGFMIQVLPGVLLNSSTKR